jgi:XapX domain-containing protein
LVDTLLSFGCGFILGGIFALLHLPIPAPRAMAGVAGVAGITLAFIIVERVRS